MSELFCKEPSHPFVLKGEIGDDGLLQLFNPFKFRSFKTTLLRAPLLKRCSTDAVVSQNIGNRYTTIWFFENRHNLALAKFGLAHIKILLAILPLPTENSRNLCFAFRKIEYFSATISRQYTMTIS